MEKMAAMRFQQVQRFILAKKIFWGWGTLKFKLFASLKECSFQLDCYQICVFDFHTDAAPRLLWKLSLPLSLPLVCDLLRILRDIPASHRLPTAATKLNQGLKNNLKLP